MPLNGIKNIRISYKNKKFIDDTNMVLKDFCRVVNLKKAGGESYLESSLNTAHWEDYLNTPRRTAVAFCCFESIL